MTKENFRKTAVRKNMRETGQTYTQASEELRETDTNVKPDLKLPVKTLPTFDDIITNEHERKYLLETIFEPYQQQDVYSDHRKLTQEIQPESSNPVVLVMGDVESGKTLFIEEYIRKLSEKRQVGYLPESSVNDKNQMPLNISGESDKNPNMSIFSAAYYSRHYPTECLIRSHQLGLEAVGMDIDLLNNPYTDHVSKFFNETMSDSDRKFLFVGKIDISESKSNNIMNHMRNNYDSVASNREKTLDLQKLKAKNPIVYEDFSKQTALSLLQNVPYLRFRSSMRPKVNAIIFLTRTNRITGPEFDHELIIL